MTDRCASAFIELALAHEALQLGSFTLKSGRQSPYFLNCGKLVDATAAKLLGELYATRIESLELGPNPVLLGLPYKGIPLAALAAAALGRGSFAYLRTAPKDHGEGGLLVGSIEADAQVVLIDDVLTAGTAANLALAQLGKLAIRPCAMVVAFDRMERVSATDARSAAKVIASEHNLKVAALATVKDLLDCDEVATEHKQKLTEHLAEHGAAG